MEEKVEFKKLSDRWYSGDLTEESPEYARLVELSEKFPKLHVQLAEDATRQASMEIPFLIRGE